MTTHLVPDRLALPPPLALDLVDAGRAAGWIADNAVGFRGFGDATEAAHAAWVAHRTIARRLARTHGMRPTPVDIEPLAIRRIEAKEMILASGRPIAALVRPGPGSRSGADSFGFELMIPTPITELEARAIAYLAYRTLRKSGIRWAMWGTGARPVVEETATTQARVETMAEPSLTKFALAALPLSLAAVLFAGVAQSVPMPLTATLLAGMVAGGVMLLRSRRLR